MQSVWAVVPLLIWMQWQGGAAGHAVASGYSQRAWRLEESALGLRSELCSLLWYTGCAARSV